jgi:hypothetical protein
VAGAIYVSYISEDNDRSRWQSFANRCGEDGDPGCRRPDPSAIPAPPKQEVSDEANCAYWKERNGISGDPVETALDNPVTEVFKGVPAPSHIIQYSWKSPKEKGIVWLKVVNGGPAGAPVQEESIRASDQVCHITKVGCCRSCQRSRDRENLGRAFDRKPEVNRGIRREILALLERRESGTRAP